MSYFFFDYICKNFMMDGKVENWLLIVDCGNVGVSELPIKKLKGFMSAMKQRFRSRVFRTIAIESPWLFRAVWSMFLSSLDKYIQKKIVINGPDSKNCLLEYIDISELEEKYGG